MRYYFFETSEQMRDGKMKPTLRALPNQTFPDGTPVNTALNVQAPKEPGSSANGTRLEYPLGTIFCSNFLKMVTTAKRVYYSVYDDENGVTPGQTDPDFHPVATTPSFTFVRPQHQSKKMDAAYVSFITFGDQTDGQEEPTPASATPGTPAVRHMPFGPDGKARGPIDTWQPSYEDQVDTEAEVIASWMRRVLNDLGVRAMSVRPKASDVIKMLVEKLYRRGENADTIISRARFNAMYGEQKMDTQGIAIITGGPLSWYLTGLLNEHEKAADCSAVRRDATSIVEVGDVAFLVSQELCRQNGTSDTGGDASVTDNFKKAVEMGWTLDDILVPDVLLSQPDPRSLAAALATGAIPLPERDGKPSGTSYIDTLMSLKQNKRPKDKDGFHVDEKTWKLMILDLNRKKNTLLVGPTGCGKTQLVEKMCEQTGTPFTIIPMGTITDPTEQLVGKMDIASNPNSPKMETEFDWADFALAIQRPGVVLLDEVNRIPRNGFNILFSVLDGTRALVASGAKSSDKRTIPVHPDCVFFATANIGGEYTGTDELDAAFDNRFRRIELDYLDYKTEAAILVARTGIRKEDAENIALVAKNIRSKWQEGNGELTHAVSTRETLDCAELVKDGFDVEEALELAFLPHFEKGASDKDPNSERGRVRGMIATRMNNAS